MVRLPKKIQDLIKADKYYTRKHFFDRQLERGLKNVDVKKALMEGEVIEYVYKYGIGEKFVLYCEYKDKIFHIPIVFKNGSLILRTIYIPDNRYEKDKKTRLNKKI